MATERDYQGFYDRIAALRDQVTSRLASDLITNPQLADALNKQIDDMLQSVVDADAKALPPPDKGLAELAGIGPRGRQRLRRSAHPAGRRPLTTRPSPRNASSPSATCTTSISTRRSASSASCRSCRSCSRRVRCGSRVGTGAFALYQFDRRDVLRYTAARSARRLPARPRLRQRARAGGLAAEHRLPHAVRALHPPGHAVLARQAHLATSSASAPTIRASARSPSSAAPGSTCATI